jgi:hypothetical protein
MYVMHVRKSNAITYEPLKTPGLHGSCSDRCPWIGHLNAAHMLFVNANISAEYTQSTVDNRRKRSCEIKNLRPDEDAVELVQRAAIRRCAILGKSLRGKIARKPRCSVRATTA